MMCFGVARECEKNMNKLHCYISRQVQCVRKKLRLIHQKLQYILFGGLYWSSVQVQGSLAAPELAPTEALLIASPTVN